MLYPTPELHPTPDQLHGSAADAILLAKSRLHPLVDQHE